MVHLWNCMSEYVSMYILEKMESEYPLMLKVIYKLKLFLNSKITDFFHFPFICSCISLTHNKDV